MSTANVDDVQYVLSDETVQVPQPNNGVVIHSQPNNGVVIHPQPQASSQINTQALQTSSPYSALLASLNQVNEKIPVRVASEPKRSHQSYSEKDFNIYEYKSWSIFNIIFCCACIGGYAYYMSSAINEKKEQGDLLRARCYSKLVVKLNILATLSGIFVFTLVGLRIFGLMGL